MEILIIPKRTLLLLFAAISLLISCGEDSISSTKFSETETKQAIAGKWNITIETYSDPYSLYDIIISGDSLKLIDWYKGKFDNGTFEGYHDNYPLHKYNLKIEVDHNVISGRIIVYGYEPFVPLDTFTIFGYREY